LSGIKPEPSRGQPRDKVSARAYLADADSLALEILGPADRRVRGQNIIESITHGADELQLFCALGPGVDHGGRPLQLEKQVAGKRGLNAHQPSSDIDWLEFQAVFLERPRPVRDPEKTGGTP
jgi:hypothetical protein